MSARVAEPGENKRRNGTSRWKSRHHIHTIIRMPNGGDYGADLLAEHHARFDHADAARPESDANPKSPWPTRQTLDVRETNG